MSYGIVNADQIGTSVQGYSLGAGNSSLLKNKIINGACVIDQRNAGASVTPTAGQFTLDRYAFQVSQTSKLTCQQNAGSVTPPIGFSNYLGITSSSAYSVTSTDFFFLYQVIEGFNSADLQWGTANAKTVTLSFQVYSSLTGTFSGSFRNNAGNRSYPFTYTVSLANTWTTISITVAGDTTGTWVGATNGKGIFLTFGLGSGPTRLGTANSWQAGDFDGATGSVSVVGTSGATFYITGVQLEVGSSATGFEYRQYQQELALCQRYYQVVGSLSGYASSTTVVQMAVPMFVSMRASPTVGATGVLATTDGSANYTESSVTFGGSLDPRGGPMSIGNFTGLTANRPMILNPGVNGNYMTLSAEL